MAEHLSTLPAGIPELTLGWGVLKHAMEFIRQPNGPKAGEWWKPTPGQVRFALWWYALDKSLLGTPSPWIFHHGVRRLAKGSGKSPNAAVFALEELVGPVRFDRLDGNAPGGCIGKPVSMPLVQIAATAESQTANTMRMVRAMASKGSKLVREYHIDIGKTIFYTPGGGELQVITSSASAAEGAEVTFAIEDETEHWLPSTGGPDLADTLDRNLAKSSSRAIETANAWIPRGKSDGEHDDRCVAQRTFEAWELQQNGSVDKDAAKILYDARIASPDTLLDDETSLMAALDFVFEDCEWMDRRTIRGRILDPRNKPDVSRRFYLNQPTATADSWTTPQAWGALAHPEIKVKPREKIAMFFDGSKSRDATALVGCRISDGFVFKIGIWEPKPAHDTVDVVDQADVNRVVVKAHADYDVVAFFADVQEFEGFVKTQWPEAWGDDYVIMAVPGGKRPESIAWDMRSHKYEFAAECELVLAEIDRGGFAHDGDEAIARHVANARNRVVGNYVGISKESRDSAHKIDAAVAMIGARMVRRLVQAAKTKPEHDGRVYFG